MKKLISLGVIIGLVLITLWLQSLIEQSPIVTVEKKADFIDYFIEDFNSVNMNEQGQPEWLLRATRLEHYRSGRTLVFNPVMQFVDSNEHWQVQAQRAEMHMDQQVVQLFDDVRIDRSASSSESALDIKTSYLHIDMKRQQAETDQQAFIHSDNLSFTTTGMVFDYRNAILKLSSNVSGTYEIRQ